MLFNKNNRSTKEHHDISSNNHEISSAHWLDYDYEELEGQLAVDVFQTDKKIIVKSTIAGVKPEDLKISLHNDLLSIKGHRFMKEVINEEDYLYRECYWGPFSRSIILPSEVDGKRVEADLESGVLTITLYKNHPNKIEVRVKD